MNKPALGMELKYAKNAVTALNQIKDKNYVQALKDYEGDLILVGISYDKDTRCHECAIERLIKQGNFF